VVADWPALLAFTQQSEPCPAARQCPLLFSSSSRGRAAAVQEQDRARRAQTGSKPVVSCHKARPIVPASESTQLLRGWLMLLGCSAVNIGTIHLQKLAALLVALDGGDQVLT
jgi:hypothetical protein